MEIKGKVKQALDKDQGHVNEGKGRSLGSETGLNSQLGWIETDAGKEVRPEIGGRVKKKRKELKNI